MKVKKYKLQNRISQPVQLLSGQYIFENGFLIVETITIQMKNLEQKGFIKIKEQHF